MKILNINSSSNKTTSTSTNYAEKVVEKLISENQDTTIVTRHTTYSNLPFIDESILGALFPAGERTEAQKKALELSDELTNELLDADVVVISAPIYNFSIPASLKAYFDLVARAGLTFRYTETGPIGLLKTKKVYIVVSSGGTEIGSSLDFAGKYIQQFLAFLGATNVEFVELDQLMIKGEEKLVSANNKVASIA